jgi:hypothetical protein
MAHTLELVVQWLFWAVVIAILSGIIALVWRKVSKRDWPNLIVLEAAVAIGVVVSFVGLILAIAMPS